MDIQVLATLTNIAQVVAAVWVLLLGSRTIPSLLRREKSRADSAHAPDTLPPSASRVPDLTSFLETQEHGASGVPWLVTGVFLLVFSSIAWLIVRSSSSPSTLSWYDILLVGFNATALALVWVEKRNQTWEARVGMFDSKQITLRSHLFLFVGMVIAGPLGAEIVALLLGSLHWHLALVALASLLGGGLLILIYLVVVRDSFAQH